MRDGATILSASEVEKAIDDLVSLGTSGLGITGGEPLLCPDTLHILRYAKARGLLTHLSTNGLLVDETMARDLLDTGVDAIGISVDGLDAETHDRMRGMPGAFDKALQALGLLARLRGPSGPRLIVVCVLCEGNLKQIPHIAEMVLSKGADYFNVMPQHRSDPGVASWQSGDHLKLPMELYHEADLVLDDLLRMRKQTGHIDSSGYYLKILKKCIRGEKLPVPCYAGHVTYVLDCYGEIFPCFGWVQMGRRGPNVRDLSVRRTWESADMARSRLSVKGCRLCYWNCQTELSLLYWPKAWFCR